jgi:hypothetical protein
VIAGIFSRTANLARITGLPCLYKPDYQVVHIGFYFYGVNFLFIKNYTMKKFLVMLFLVAAGYHLAEGRSVPINEKIVMNFKEIYPNAMQVSWIENPETYTVYFVENGIKVNIIFNRDGSFVSSARYYKEEYLPYYLLAEIRKKYPSKKVYGVSEMTTPGMISYFVKLEDAKSWITIKMDSEGNMKLVEKFKKAL